MENTPDKKLFEHMPMIKVTKELAEEFKRNGGKIIVSEKDLTEMSSKFGSLLTVKGRIIDASLRIERELESLISSLLFGMAKKGEAKFFERFILNTDHLNFSSKLRIFRSLYKTCSYLKMKEPECSALATRIRGIMEIRDNFAHGQIIFRDIRPPIVPYLSYYKENEPKEQKLDESYFNQINDVFNDCLRGLAELKQHVKECYDRQLEMEWTI
jgi:hypothetical protein